ncbi:MAG: UDP-N-acetylmuramate dehydrogenase [Candidatus Fermentibacter daniensis]|nr:UDP-N-acetylmuramate dehydrogenase [Candidatus Fermentibacter daniensis]
MDRGSFDALATAFPGCVKVMALSSLTTWRIGGEAAVIEARSAGMLADILGRARELGVEVFLLGRGSNLLVSDDGYDGLVVRLAGDFGMVSWTRGGDGWLVSAGAAVTLPGLAGAACMKGAAGLEFAVGIPGSLGGAVFMNAGAYGGSMADRGVSVEVLDGNGFRTMDRAACGFGYRASFFQDSDALVLSVLLSLDSGDRDRLMESASATLRKRRESFPLDLPNAGSVFRRVEGAPPPGKLIEDAGLKGRRVGGAMISKLHANFIVNAGGASSSDVFGLIHDAGRVVYDASGVSLREEIRYLGSFEEPQRGR